MMTRCTDRRVGRIVASCAKASGFHDTFSSFTERPAMHTLEELKSVACTAAAAKIIAAPALVVEAITILAPACRTWPVFVAQRCLGNAELRQNRRPGRAELGVNLSGPHYAALDFERANLIIRYLCQPSTSMPGRSGETSQYRLGIPASSLNLNFSRVLIHAHQRPLPGFNFHRSGQRRAYQPHDSWKNHQSELHSKNQASFLGPK